MNAKGRLGGAWRGRLLGCLSGLLLSLAYPPADLGLVALIALVPFLVSLEGVGRGGALGRGYACGAVFFALLLDWIPRVMHTYGGLPVALSWLILALLVFYLATYFALFALLIAASWRRFGPATLALAPVAWVALELARGRLLTGFPWGLLGYSQYRNTLLLQAASWGGIYAVSGLVLAANAGVALLIARPGAPRFRGIAAILLALVGASHLAGLVVLRGAARAPAGTTLSVAAIQANIAQDVKWEPGRAATIVSELARLTRQAAAGGARLIVWPESSSPLSVRRPDAPGSAGSGVVTDSVYVSFLGGLARELHVDLIVGSVDYAPGEAGVRAYNAAFVVGSDGALGASYDKVHLVPFGEYVPLADLLFFVNRMVQGAIGEFAPGRRLQPLPTVAGRTATFICYEAIFPELVRRLTRRDAVLLVNITNDAWFGRSAAPDQHLAMAIVRAVENRRPMVRAANTGISALIDPYGRILARAPLLESAVLLGTVRPRDDRTVYTRCGDLLAWGCVILTLLQCAALRAAFSRQGP